MVEQEGVQEVFLETGLPENVLELTNEEALIYRLRVQKQPGIIALPLEIMVNPPEGYVLNENTDGWEWDSSKSAALWGGEIKKTTDFELVFIINTAE